LSEGSPLVAAIEGRAKVSAWEDSTTWIAVGASVVGALVLVGLILGIRMRRPRPKRHERGEGEGRPAATELMDALARAQEEAAHAQLESRNAREESERARTELRWLRHLSEIGATVDLEGILQRALEAATRLANAAAAMIVLARGEDEPLVATFGLSPEESSSREFLGTPPEGGQARAVTLAYRYTEDEMEWDEFRLRGGLALPVVDERGDRAGTLALFWRRVEREISDEELGRLEALTAALAPALENAFRFEELRRLADLDPVTALPTRRFLREALVRECARARRYERRLSLLLLRVHTSLTEETVRAAGERLAAAVRTADLACHLDDGCFAVVLPEGALADAERLYRRLQFALGAKLGGDERVELSAGIVELRPDDDAVSLLQRAETALERDEEPGPGLSSVIEPAG
jgi:diguanylate cyclase (GGDEF)-like protein